MTRQIVPNFLPTRLAKDGWWLVSHMTTPMPQGSTPSARPGLSDIISGEKSPLVGAVLWLVILADWLFWDRYIGISLALFAVVVVGLAVTVNWSTTSARSRQKAVIVVFVSILPCVNQIGFFPVLFLLIGTSAAVLILHDRLRQLFWKDTATLLWFLGTGPFWIFREALGPAKEVASEVQPTRHLSAWILPLGLGLIFLSLFIQANPVFEDMVLSVIDMDWFYAINVPRVLFWLGVICCCWPFLHMRVGRTGREKAPKGERVAPIWFDQIAIRNALMVFNALFAIQMSMDLSYLWGGVDLPKGMSFAQYAHKGAYPLLATALLAGLFMLAATSFGPLSRINARLLQIWIAQNVALVISSILRLNLYVAFYSLTYLRVAAFIWMGLVMAGLLLIAYRLWADRSNSWVLSRIAGIGICTIYLTCFVNFASLIGAYNVTHSKEISGEGQPLDRTYLCGLGAGAYRAADRFLRVTGSPVEGFHWDASGEPGTIADDFWRHQESWRDWGLRDHRMARYLRAKF